MCVREREIYLSSLYKFYLGFPNFRSFVHNSCIKVLRPHLFTYSSFTYWAPRNLYVYQQGLWMNRLGQLYGLEGLLYVCVCVTCVWINLQWPVMIPAVPPCFSCRENFDVVCAIWGKGDPLIFLTQPKVSKVFNKVILSGSDPLFTRAWRVEQK